MKNNKKVMVLSLLMFVLMLGCVVVFATPAPGYTTFTAVPGGANGETKVTITGNATGMHMMAYTITENADAHPEEFTARPLTMDGSFVSGGIYQVPENYWINVYNMNMEVSQIQQFQSLQITSGMRRTDATIAPNFQSSNVPINTPITLTFVNPIRKLDDSPLTIVNLSDSFEIQVDDGSNTVVSFAATVTDTQTFVLTPSTDLDLGQKYKIIYNGSAEYYTDVAVPSFTSGFYTGVEMNATYESNANIIRYSGQMDGEYKYVIVDSNYGEMPPTSGKEVFDLHTALEATPVDKTYTGAFTVAAADPEDTEELVLLVPDSTYTIFIAFKKSGSSNEWAKYYKTQFIGIGLRPDFSDIANIYAYPVGGDIDVKFPTQIRKENNDPLDNTLIKNYIVLKQDNASGANIPYSATFGMTSDSATVEINPTDPLPYGSDIYLEIIVGIEGQGGGAGEYADMPYVASEYTITTQAPELLNGVSFVDDPATDNKTKAVLGALTTGTKFVYKRAVTESPIDLVRVGDDLTSWSVIAHDQIIIADNSGFFGVAEVNASNEVIQFSNAQAVVIAATPAQGLNAPGLSFADDAATEDKTVITLGSKYHGDNSYYYKKSENDDPIPTPDQNEIMSLTGWTIINSGEIIEATDGQNIGVVEIDVSNEVVAFANEKAVVTIFTPYTSDMTAVMKSHEGIELGYQMNKSTEVFYAVYPVGTSLTNITNQDVNDGTILGTASALTKGTFNETSTDPKIKIVQLPICDQNYLLDDYQIAISTKVGAVYYGQPNVLTISNKNTKMLLEHTGSTKQIPGVFSSGTTKADVQAIVENSGSMFKLNQTLGAIADQTPDLVLIKNTLIESKSYLEIKAIIDQEYVDHLLETSKDLFVGTYAAGGEYDVSTLNLGAYTVYLRNNEAGVYGGDISLAPMVNACIVIKSGLINYTINPVYEGKSSLVVVKFNGLLDVLDIDFHYFADDAFASVNYNGGALPSPSSHTVNYENNIQEQTTSLSIVYSDTPIDLIIGETLAIDIKESYFNFFNGQSLVTSSGSTTIVAAMNEIQVASYLKSQSVTVTNPTNIRIKYLLVKSDIIDDVPAVASNIGTFITSHPTKVAHNIAEPSSDVAIDISGMELGLYHLVGVPEGYLDNIYVSPKSENTITIYQQTHSSSSNDDDDDDPTPEPTPVVPAVIKALTQLPDPKVPVNDQLDQLRDILDGIKTPEEAEKSVGIIGKRITDAGGNVDKLNEKEKEMLVESLSDLMKKTQTILDKVGNKADKAELVGELIKSTQKVIDALKKVEEKDRDKKLANKLNNSLIDLANKVIQQESKVVIKKDTLVMPADITEPLAKSAKLKNQLEQKLKEAGIKQELKALKQTVLFKVEGDGKGASEIGFHQDTIKALAEQVENIQLDFGNTGIQINSEVMRQAQSNMYFTTEDLPKKDTDRKPEGHEEEDIKVRQVEAFEGKEKIKEFKKPVKVSFKLKDFIDGEIKKEDVASLVVMVQNEETGEWEPTGGNYDEATGMITFYRIHMSKYTVVKNKKKFSDVENSWAKDEINNLLGKGIADANTEFRPTETITREEFAAWICRAYGLKEEGHSADFADIDQSNPYYKEITNAATQGLILGRSTTEFAPKEEITREEMATLVARAISNYNDVKVPNDGAVRFASLVDDENTADWAVDSVAMMIDLGIMEADNSGNFNPQEPISKEAAADIFAKIYK